MKKKGIKRKIASALMVAMLTGSIVGCGKQSLDTQTVIGTADDTETIEVNQNDFRGGVKRIEAIRGNVLGIVSAFNQKNFELQEEYPCSYWNSEEYQYFVAHCINGEIYYYTDLCNEFETDWATVESAVAGMLTNSDGKTPQDYALKRLTDNHYTLSFREQNVMSDWRTRAGDVTWTYDCIYNPTHDWVQEVKYGWSRAGSDKTQYQDMFLEYGRRDNVFILQTERERLYVVYENVEPMTVENSTMYIVNSKGKEIPVTQEDIDNGSVSMDDVQYHTNTIITYNPLKDNKIKAFYYSRLDGNILPQYIKEDDENALEEADGLGTRGVKDESVDYELTTDEGYVITHYNTCDSMFTHIDDITKDWVTEMGTYAQVITYENGNLTVKTANQLSHEYEIFKFYDDGSVANSKEPMEEVKVEFIPTVSGDEAEAEEPEVVETHYGLFEMNKNTKGNVSLSDISLMSVKTELPISVDDFQKLGFKLVAEDFENYTYMENNDYMAFIVKAFATEGEEAELTDKYLGVGFLENDNMALDEAKVKCINADIDGADGLDVSFAGITLKEDMEYVESVLGDGEKLSEGYGYCDGKDYLYITYDLMQDGDIQYWGVKSMTFFTKEYVDSIQALDFTGMTDSDIVDFPTAE